MPKNQHSWDLGIKAGTLIPMDKMGHTLANQFIGIKNGRIESIQKFKPGLKLKSKRYLDLGNKIVLPGLINAHTHLGMSLFRGVEDNLSLKSWLFDKIFPLEGAFVSKSFVKLGTTLSAFECLRFGTTCVSDMYFYPEEALKVWDQMGLRGVFAQPVISFSSPESADGNNTALLKKFELLFNKYKNHPRLGVSIGPHAPYTCSPELLTEIRALQKKHDCIVHTHLAETESEVQDIQTRFKKSPTQFLFDLDLLGPKTLCAHVVHTTPQDQKLLASTRTPVVHNPDSNFKLGSGIAPICDYLEQGITVALGTDGVASNNDLSMFGAMDLMAKGQKVFAPDISRFTTWMALWSATQGGAKALSLDHIIGSIEPGKQADIIAVDPYFAHLQPISDPVSHLVFSTQGLEVDTTIVSGKVLMKDKRFLVGNFDSTIQKAQKERAKIQKFLSKSKGAN